MSEITKEILQAVQKAATDGRLSCGEAHRLAEELQVSKGLIGAAADQLKIKITACQLGCF